MSGEHQSIRATTALGRLLCHSTETVERGVKLLRCESREMCAGERCFLGGMSALLLLLWGHHLLVTLGCHWLAAVVLAGPLWIPLWIAAVVVIGMISTLSQKLGGRRAAMSVQNSLWYALLTVLAYVGVHTASVYCWLGWLWFGMMLANGLAWIVVTLLGTKR